MNILITEKPNQANAYIDSLANAYKKSGNSILFTTDNFYYSNFIPDVIHINWPESLYKWQVDFNEKKDLVGFIAERLDFFKKKGSIIINTVHNIQPHEIEKNWEHKVYNLIISKSDVFIHHGKKSIELLNQNYPVSVKKINIVAHHGDYLSVYEKRDKKLLRKKYKIPRHSFVILNFGNQRPYKGEKFIDEIFKRINLSGKYLITAGNFHYDHRSQINFFISRLKKRIRCIRLNNIHRMYRRITEDEVKDLFNLADLLVLGHQKGLSTGLIPLAATFSLPVVFPHLGNFKEQAEDWSDYFYKPENLQDAITTIERAYSQRNCNKSNAVWLKKNSWEIHVKYILDAVEKSIYNFKNHGTVP